VSMKKEEPELVIARVSPLNAEAPVRALRSSTTPVSSFFVRSHFAVPRVKLSGWRLSVGGEVDNPRELSYLDLLKMPMKEVSATLECAGNGRAGFAVPAEGELRWGHGAVGNATWTGVPLRAVLGAALPRKGAKEVVFHGADSGVLKGEERALTFSRSLPVEKAMDGDTMIAVKMNGARLTPEHGYPARLVVPGWYGVASVKWLNRIELVSGKPYRAFFNGVKYVYVRGGPGEEISEPVSEMRVKSLITQPSEGDEVDLGRRVEVAGKAWSGGAMVSRVDVDLGDGWRRAELQTSSAGPFEWVGWSIVWTPRKKGEQLIRARATDGRGNVQPLEPEDNRYQYGYNAVSRLRVRVV